MIPTSSDARSRRRPLPPVVERAAAAFFGAVAALRDRRGLHPKGTSFSGRAVLHEDGRGLAESSEVGVEVRVSRGAGLPHPVPDFNGVAVRFLDAHGPGCHQDLLLTAAGALPVLRHLIVPMPYLTSSGYSTVLPYRTPAGSLCVFRCDPLPIQTVTDTAALPIEVEVLVATLLGSWTPAATLTLTSVLPSDARLRFDAWNTGPQLLPSGVLNRLRAPAYAGSRAGAPVEDGSEDVRPA